MLQLYFNDSMECYSILHSSTTLMTPILEASMIIIEVFAFYECIFLSLNQIYEVSATGCNRD
jgi:hypothetical protein